MREKPNILDVWQECTMHVKVLDPSNNITTVTC